VLKTSGNKSLRSNEWIMNRMMGFMPIPQKSMHDVLMREPGNKFPKEKGANNDKQTKYDH
jgi:hypothetical protein